MHRLYGFPDGLADTFALNTHLHIEERQFASVFSFIDGNDGTAHTLTILADGFVSFGTSCSHWDRHLGHEAVIGTGTWGMRDKFKFY